MNRLASMTPLELGDSGAREAVGYLIGFLREGSTNDKRLAASAIHKLASLHPLVCVAAVPSLLNNLKDQSPQVRQYSLKTLLDLEVSASEEYQVCAAFEREDRDYNKDLMERLLEKMGVRTQVLEADKEQSFPEPPPVRTSAPAVIPGSLRSQVRETLENVFRFTEFRPGQEEAVLALFEERRLLCIQPTGYGKSLLYQLPAVLLEGMTLVISPLLALVRDQIGHLRDRFGILAGSINTDQDEEENEATRKAALAGTLRILFVAPEQLDNLSTRKFVSELPVDLLVVDEAHCISTWGHDFRPSYRQIVQAVRELADRRKTLHVLGLTATADEKTEGDIAQQLGVAGGKPLRVLRSSMDRPNISLSVVPVTDFVEKLAWLQQHIPSWQGCGILYCATRDNAEVTAEFLRKTGVDAVAYHAGMEPDVKRRLQEAFLSGRHQVIAATNALGMGIDKSDVRFIVHIDLPSSITAYYQEVGRAGRDGKPSRGVLLFDPEDRRIQEHFIRSAQPDRRDCDKALQCLVPDEDETGPTLMKIKARSGLHPTKVNVILAELMEQGFVTKKLSGKRQVYERVKKTSTVDLSRYERQLAIRTRELDAMLRYGRGEVDCLMHALRSALGDTASSPCGHCSRCDPAAQTVLMQPGSVAEARDWAADRSVVIPSYARPQIGEGISILDGQQRSAMFLEFMRRRSEPASKELQEKLLALLKRKVAVLREARSFSVVAPIPSRGWAQRKSTALLVAQALGAELVEDMFTWKQVPAHLQGELLNNDQRRENVEGKLAVNQRRIPRGEGAVLLLDDYIGSGSTMKEAARSLRKEGGYAGEIIPMTVARVRWRLGAEGMV